MSAEREDKWKEMARDIFMADNSNSSNPSREWHKAPPRHREYAYAIAEKLILMGYAKEGEHEPN